MTFKLIYQCTGCRSTDPAKPNGALISPPDYCPQCARRDDILVPGKIINGLKLIEMLEGEGKWHCECLFCGNMKEFRTGNIRRQNSCGCLRRSTLTAEQFNGTMVLCKCRKCGLAKEYELDGNVRCQLGCTL